MKVTKLFQLMMLTSLVFVSLPKVSAQELDDVEADMDTAISESDAAQSAEEYGRKREAEEKSKLGVAKKQAESFAVKAGVVKDASTRRLGDLEKQTAKLVSERKAFDVKTEKSKAEIVSYETKVKDAEELLAKSRAEKEASVLNLKNAEATLAAHKKQLADLAAKRKIEIASLKTANRKLASIAGSLPGKTISMAKTCPMHVAMDFASTQTRFLKKGEKVELAKVGSDGWFHVRTPNTKGFMHKTCK